VQAEWLGVRASHEQQGTAHAQSRMNSQ